jgi:trk system potassium uptake protein TrkH
VDLNRLTSASRAMTVVLMLVGGAPGSTAGGVKTTTAAVLAANAAAVVRRRKSPRLFSRRIDEDTVRSASTLLTLYLFLALAGAFVISAAEGLPFEPCIFETVSAIGTVGLSMGITPSLGPVSRCVLMGLMFFDRVGGLTLLYAAVSPCGAETSRFPLGRINVG